MILDKNTVFMYSTNMQIERDLEKLLLKELKTDKAIVLTGMRRVGKTTLVEKIKKKEKKRKAR